MRDPFSPMQFAWVVYGGGHEALTVAVSGHRLYVGQSSSFTIYDISKPAAPVETSYSRRTGHPGLLSANQEVVAMTMSQEVAAYRTGATNPSQHLAVHALLDYADGVIADQTRKLAVVTRRARESRGDRPQQP